MEHIEQDDIQLDHPVEGIEMKDESIVEGHDSPEDILLEDVDEKHVDHDQVDLLSDDDGLLNDEENKDVMMNDKEEDKEEDKDFDIEINEAGDFGNGETVDQPVMIVDEASQEIKNDDGGVNEATIKKEEDGSPIEYVSPQKDTEEDPADLEEIDVIEINENDDGDDDDNNNKIAETNDNQTEQVKIELQEDQLLEPVSGSTSPKAISTVDNEVAENHEQPEATEQNIEKSGQVNQSENGTADMNNDNVKGEFPQEAIDYTDQEQTGKKLEEEHENKEQKDEKEGILASVANEEENIKESVEDYDDQKEATAEVAAIETNDQGENEGEFDTKEIPQEQTFDADKDEQGEYKENDNEDADVNDDEDEQVEKEEEEEIKKEFQESDEISEYCPIPVILRTDVFPYLLCPISPENYSKLPSEYENVINLFDDNSILKSSLLEIFSHIRDTFNEHGNPFNEDEELVLTFKDFEQTSIEESSILAGTLLLENIIEMFCLTKSSKNDYDEVPECLCLQLSSRKSFKSQMQKIWSLKTSQDEGLFEDGGSVSDGKESQDDYKGDDKKDDFELSEEELSELNKAMSSDEDQQEESNPNDQEEDGKKQEDGAEESDHEGSITTKRSINEVQENTAINEGSAAKKQK